MGPFSVTGQPNAMGGREVGALANQLAAHMDFSPPDLDRVRRFWQAPSLASKPGLKAVDLFHAVERGEIKAVWVMATNPVVSLPDADQVRRALASAELVVVSDCVRNSDTVDAAHIRLPVLAWGEKDGTVTNSERRISRQRPFLPAPGEAKPEWWVLSEVARRLGHGTAFAYGGAADVFREHAALSGFENDGLRDFDISGLEGASFDAIAPVQWPMRVGRAGGRFFAEGGFYTADGKARFVAVRSRAPAESTDATFPLRLNTGRMRDQWHTMTRTGRSPRLSAHAPEPAVEVHPRDATAAGLTDGALAQVDSRWGKTVMRVRVTDTLRPGEIFAPMHWTAQFAAQGRVNAAVNPAVDAASGQPELKHTPARIAPWTPRWYGFLLSRERILPETAYWVLSIGENHWRCEIADTTTMEHAARSLGARLDATAERLQLIDRATGTFRAAWVAEGRLAACLFLGASPTLPPRAWLAKLFAQAELATADRAALLAGRAPSGSIDTSPMICACHAVSQAAIRGAINSGAASAEAVGAATRAGTNCGSCLPEIRKLLAATARRTAVA